MTASAWVDELGPIVGAVLAGGAGRRLQAGVAGGPPSKATAFLAGRALVSYPLEALAAVCDRVAVVAKRQTDLPADLASVERWNEPDEPRHPLTGIVHALERADGRPVLVCAADMPFVSPSAGRELIAAARGAGAKPSGPGRPRPAHALARRQAPIAAVAEAGGELEPLLGVYRPEALPALRAATADAPLRAVIEGLDPLRVALPASVLRSVNTPADLEAAAGELNAVVV